MRQFAWGFAPPYILASALDLGLFKHVAEGKTTASALAAATGASRRGLDMLLNMMTNFGFLARNGSGDAATYSLTPESDAFLVAGRPAYLGGIVQFNAKRMHRTWSQLTECIKSGQPAVAVDMPEEGTPFWAELVDNLFPMNYPNALRMHQELRRLYPTGVIRLLDVAAGSGVWGIAPAQQDPYVQVVAFDLPETLEITRRNADRMGVIDRFAFRPGNVRDGALGEQEFDAVILGHICHSEGAGHTQRLLASTARALNPGGTVVIADMVPDDDRSGPTYPLLFALNMLVHTSEGDTFTLAEYEVWLRDAGFTDVRPLEGTQPSPLILATKP
jgi:ubiquinone/menaquinone biosynthesis C-methylase UbiE